MTPAQFISLSDEMVCIAGTHDDEIILKPAHGTTMSVQIAADARCSIAVALPSADSRNEFRILFHINQRASVRVMHQANDEKKQLKRALSISYDYHLAADAQLTVILDSQGAENEELRVACFLEGDRSSATIRGVQYAIHEQVKNLTIKQIHRGQHTSSSSLVHGAVAGTGGAFFYALIKIEPAAAHADAQQISKHLLLSPAARAVAVPAIEVLNDRVRCKHGSAVSQLDPEMIFYLQTRGLPAGQATSLVTHFFLAQPLSFSR